MFVCLLVRFRCSFPEKEVCLKTARLDSAIPSHVDRPQMFVDTPLVNICGSLADCRLIRLFVRSFHTTFCLSCLGTAACITYLVLCMPP